MVATCYLGLVLVVGQVIVTLAVDQEEQFPSLKHSLTTPVIKVEGDDALLTCVVRNQANFTLMWKKAAKEKAGNKILTANKERITSDERLKIMHEDGGQVYVLVVANVTSRDAGMYICELNSDPTVRSFHELKVLSAFLQPPLPTSESSVASGSTASTKDSVEVWGYSTESPIDHDFSSCCAGRNISTVCQGFCNLKSILDGNTGVNPSDCEEEFPSIVSCMADGRNHMPCCLEAGIPDVCTDLCRGEYTVQTDKIKSLFSCSSYTAPTLACIAAGIETLPKQPQGFSVEALNDTSIKIEWLPPGKRDLLTHSYRVNVTYLQFLSPIFSVKVDTSKAKEIYPPHSALHEIPRGKAEYIINGLEKFSLYEVSMLALNKNGGASLPTYGVKVVTHMEGRKKDPKAEESPSLPDIRSCCISNNVSHALCVDRFCDPRNVASSQLTDLMICAPWDTEMFQCLADGKDHTPCCAAKQIPPLCQELCSGNVTDINFKYFRCLSYMTELSSCMLEGYGVLPSSPVNFRFSNLQTTFGILHWDRPETLGETVVDYLVKYQKITPNAGKQMTVEHAQSPFILEHLDSASTYEVFVEPVNNIGIGDPSTRIVFRSASRKLEDLLDNQTPYNQTACCLKSGMKPECLPLCSYDANTSEVKNLARLCADEFTKVVRCAAGGRDHLPCCARQGVPRNCQPLCQAVHQSSTGADFLQCLPNIGQIITCYEEGTAELPPPIKDFKAVSVQDGIVVLSWQIDDINGTFNTAHFEVYYKIVEENSTGSTVFESDQQINTTVPIVKIPNLETGKKYRFFVVSRNEKGTSLPSSIVTLNVSSEGWTGTPVQGSSSPPHLLAVESHSATWLQFAWNPPAITHPEDVLKYRLYYQQVSANLSKFDMVETDVTTVQLTGLIPNTQYSLYSTALIVSNDTKIESTPSETLIAWTDPAFPAFVEAPTIHPINMVTEGSSMTVLCIAMGTPLPTVTLYINGHPLRSEITRHMVTMVHNVTSDMGHVSCYADNGYGTPMIASRKITISRPPTLVGPASTAVMRDNTLHLQCKVDAFPAPTMAIFRDSELKQSVMSDDRISITAKGDEEDSATFYLSMKIAKVNQSDGRTYYCHANNTLGASSVPMVVNVTDEPPPVINVTQCCLQQNVSADCLDICSFSIDFDMMIRKPQCIPQFSQMMSCASDGSDHRHCCSTGGVPATCLDWCRGEAVEETEVCALSHSKTIVECFHKGTENLPGKPLNIKVRPIDKSSAMVFWDQPEKNPHAVELYRVFWRPVGSKSANKSDTVQRKLVLHDLHSGTTYEVVVKAGNSNGTSQLTHPLKFITADEFIIATSPVRSNVGGAVGIVLAVFIVLGLVAVVIYVMKKKNLIVLSVKKPDSPSVAFENPFYAVRETTSTTQAVSGEDYNVHISSSGSWQSEMSGSPSDQSSASSSPHSPDKHESTEMNPSMYEQINLGINGQGFKRFK
eukprot:TRINITY_DN5209_c0_g1_i1.p1 TRINITY_DN5209_c0_g1~~TRINITY_DN5209_c0_g1_i1.p1  ORF type:complete len:1460 (-),score=250.05 TRINITY_DN5209_c0_g1_i1:454-4833(-)